MALRDQPYLPLYVQDYLTDEKLAICSWSTQGIYIKILCILHKQKEYGTILFKQNDKQILSTCLNFASIFVRLLPVQLSEMEAALQELVDNEILTIDGNKIFQKRMVKDNTISEMRSKAAKKGGGNPILFKQKDKQNPEYENEYENVNKDNIINSNKKINKKEIDISFVSDNYLESFKKWIEYKKEKKQEYKSQTTLKTCYENLLELSGSNPEIAAKIINLSIANNWAGLFTLNNNNNGSNRKIENDTRKREYTSTI